MFETEIEEATTVAVDEVVTIEQIRQKFIEMGARKVETIEKRKGPIVVNTIELWRTLDDEGQVENEAILWIHTSGKFKVFNLLSPEEYE